MMKSSRSGQKLRLSGAEWTCKDETMSKEQKALERVLKVLIEEKLTVRESQIVLGRAARHFLEIDIKVHRFESKAPEAP